MNGHRRRWRDDEFDTYRNWPPQTVHHQQLRELMEGTATTSRATRQSEPWVYPRASASAHRTQRSGQRHSTMSTPSLSSIREEEDHPGSPERLGLSKSRAEDEYVPYLQAEPLGTNRPLLEDQRHQSSQHYNRSKFNGASSFNYDLQPDSILPPVRSVAPPPPLPNPPPLKSNGHPLQPVSANESNAVSWHTPVGNRPGTLPRPTSMIFPPRKTGESNVSTDSTNTIPDSALGTAGGRHGSSSLEQIQPVEGVRMSAASRAPNTIWRPVLLDGPTVHKEVGPPEEPKLAEARGNASLRESSRSVSVPSSLEPMGASGNRPLPDVSCSPLQKPVECLPQVPAAAIGATELLPRVPPVPSEPVTMVTDRALIPLASAPSEVSQPSKADKTDVIDIKPEELAAIPSKSRSGTCPSSFDLGPFMMAQSFAMAQQAMGLGLPRQHRPVAMCFTPFTDGMRGLDDILGGSDEDYDVDHGRARQRDRSDSDDDDDDDDDDRHANTHEQEEEDDRFEREDPRQRISPDRLQSLHPGYTERSRELGRCSPSRSWRSGSPRERSEHVRRR